MSVSWPAWYEHTVCIVLLVRTRPSYVIVKVPFSKRKSGFIFAVLVKLFN